MIRKLVELEGLALKIGFFCTCQPLESVREEEQRVKVRVSMAKTGMGLIYPTEATPQVRILCCTQTHSLIELMFSTILILSDYTMIIILVKSTLYILK